MDDEGRRRGPGLAKARAAPLVRRRRLELVAASDGRLRELFDDADVISEGRAGLEGGELVYHGSTSVRLGPGDDAGIEALARVATLDPHMRLRALRLARREASARAGGPIGTLRAEVSFDAAAGAAALGAQGAPPGARPGAPIEEPPRGRNQVVSLTIDVSAVVLRRGGRDAT
ncbi:MAG: hypothetical protein IT372_24650 [Polyangiaceae bacterium]|nr:hypothetical protein [Polyangiaceae bacterium]